MSTPHENRPPIAEDEAPSIDVAALKAKYEEERAKRIRGDAVHQYQELKDNLAHFADDPWSTPKPRSAVAESVDVLIIGAGLGGLLCAAQLRKRGIDSIRMIDTAGDFGGAWYWNRYPGCACDVDSYVYMPLLEDTGYIPTEKYAKSGEIYAHCRRIAKRFELYPRTHFHTTLTALRWDEQESAWSAATDRGDAITARFVISCTGLLNKPKLPGIPGVETFAGHSFHTSRWDYDYTGGDASGHMTGLADKVVGIIGTGSTGIQVIPKLAESAKQLLVFQRTPSSVDYRGNKPTAPEWASSLQPGWQKERVENFTVVTSGHAYAEDMIDDAWTELMKLLNPPGDAAAKPNPAEIERAEMAKMEQTRQRIDQIVLDPATAEALKPYYHYGCKRPTFSDEYLQTFNRPNVTLVDTEGRGVERITPAGAVVGGKEYELDCLIYATGFDFMTEHARESGFEVEGRGGLKLGEHWSRGARTLFGLQTHGFPNFFLLSLIQAGISQNYTHVANEQAGHIAYIIDESIRRGLTAIEPTREAEDEWVGEVLAKVESRQSFFASCTPSYYNYEGKRDVSLESNEPFLGGAMVYFDRLRRWREAGDMPGLSAIRLPEAAPIPAD